MPFMGENNWSTPLVGEWSAQKQVFRPATYADKVDRLRHPPASPPKPTRSQSLPMPEAPKAEKRVHFVDEGYGSSATSPATSPKQEPKRDDASDSDVEQLQQQKSHAEPRARRAEAQADATTQSSSRTRSTKPAALAQHASRQAAQAGQAASAPARSKRSSPPSPSQSQAQTARTGGSYRNRNGNICFDEFSYFGGC
ncbi:hypothetical protein UCRNP2_9396 [Neofusicoccum parvum UCRNP2]|uniref:Uncharacterized protein n=1 Tax=Botryosphaeria parva (strain UCR-NP2) TaxID=1287680 RepID=R1E915_BOTPV|nr:hypothetical protein UCRNP2_9396 [Neofusicoccum parvum UCRNP2]